MPNIPLRLIKPNPFRDFVLHPYNEAQVTRLQASIHATGFWVGVVARPHGAEYQMAFGHHRTEAARRDGLEEIPIEVADLSDAEMAVRLAVENAMQRGTTAAASLDAVAALVRALTASCLSCGSPAELCQIWPALTSDAGESIWARIRKGEHPGRECIQSLLPAGTYTHHQVGLALAVLRDSGRLGEATVTFDAACAQLFRLDHHLETFRSIVTDTTVRSYLPVDQQVEFGQRILTSLTGKEITAVRLREQANILFYEMIGVSRSRMRRSPMRLTNARVQDALNFMRRGTSDVKKSCNIVADLIAEGVDVSPEIVGRFTAYVREIEVALKSLAAKGRRKSNLRLIVDNKQEPAA